MRFLSISAAAVLAGCVGVAEYVLGRDAFPCGDGKDGPRYCDERGEPVSGKVLEESSDSNEMSDGSKGFYSVKDGQVVHYADYENGVLAYELDYKGDAQINYRAYFPDGRVKYREDDRGNYSEVWFYSSDGTLVYESFNAYNNEDGIRRDTYYSTNLGPIDVDSSPKGGVYYLRGVEDRRAVTPNVIMHTPVKADGFLEIYDGAGGLWQSVRLKDGVIDGDKIEHKALSRGDFDDARAISTFKDGRMVKESRTFAEGSSGWNGVARRFDRYEDEYFDGGKKKSVYWLAGELVGVICDSGATVRKCDVKDGEPVDCGPGTFTKAQLDGVVGIPKCDYEK